MANDFDWKQPDLRVLRSYGNIAVYANEHGDICLRQADQLGEPDAIVIVPRQQTAWLMAAIADELKASAEADVLPGQDRPHD